VLTLVVGVGNPWRGDDAAGPEVARRLAGAGVEVRTIEGDATGLLDAWTGHEHVALVDAAAPAASPGALHAFRADREPLPANGLRSSTHAFGVADAIELARALGRLPARVDVYAVEGAEFAVGAGLSAPVARTVSELAGSLARASR
jgi:hydrogenase maturation protease